MKTEKQSSAGRMARFLSNESESVQTLMVFIGVFVAVFLTISSNFGFSSVTHTPVGIFATSSEAMDAFGGSDAGSYLRAASELYAEGFAGAQGHYWVFNLWPPGMVFVDLALLSLERAVGIPIILGLVVLNSLAWSVALTAFYRLLSSKSRLLGLFGVTFILLSTLMTPFAQRSVALSDSFGLTAMLIFAVFLALSSAAQDRKSSWKFGLVSATSLGVAAYFRGMYETLTLFLLLFSTVILGLTVVRNWLSGRKLVAGAATIFPSLLISLGAMVIMLPWRIVAGTLVRPGDFSWTVLTRSSSYTWSQRWMPTEYFEANGQSWLIPSRINYACEIDPDRCDRIYQAEMASTNPYGGAGGGAFSYPQHFEFLVESILQSPLKYLFSRSEALFLGFMSRTGGQVGDFAVVEATLILIGLLTILVLVRRRDLVFMPVLFGIGVMILGSVGMLMLAHTETRYFAFIKLSFIFLSLTYLALKNQFARGQLVSFLSTSESTVRSEKLG